MAQYGWDTMHAKPRMPATGQTVNGAPFQIPRSAQAITLHIGSLGGGTVKLQALDPNGADVAATETWRDVKVFNLSAGGVQALAAIPENTAVTLPTAATGSGNFRLVASADQSGAPQNISILISRL